MTTSKWVRVAGPGDTFINRETARVRVVIEGVTSLDDFGFDVTPGERAFNNGWLPDGAAIPQAYWLEQLMSTGIIAAPMPAPAPAPDPVPVPDPPKPLPTPLPAVNEWPTVRASLSAIAYYAEHTFALQAESCVMHAAAALRAASLSGDGGRLSITLAVAEARALLAEVVATGPKGTP